MPSASIAQLLTKVGIVRLIFGLCLVFCGSALGYYLARPSDEPLDGRRPKGDPFAYAEGEPIDAADAWRAYFESRRQARTFVDDPKPHPFFVAVAFAIAGTLVLGVGAATANAGSGNRVPAGASPTGAWPELRS